MNTPTLPEVLKNLRSLNGPALLERTRRLALEERRIGIDLLHHLAELDRRRLYVPKFSSMHEYVVRELGYSDGAAHRRISAMRLLRTVPELEPKLRDGTVNLSTASQVQNFMREERRITGTPILPQMARRLVEEISGKSARETEALLAAHSPRVAAVLQERPRSIDGRNVQVSIVLGPELQEKLRRLRDRMAHRNPNPSITEQLEMLADFALRKLEGARSATRSNVEADSGRASNRDVSDLGERTDAAIRSDVEVEHEDAPARGVKAWGAGARSDSPSRSKSEMEHKGSPDRGVGGSSARTDAAIRSDTEGESEQGLNRGPRSLGARAGAATRSDVEAEAGQSPARAVRGSSGTAPPATRPALRQKDLRRAITLQNRRKVWIRAGARCEFRHPDGSRCSRTHLLQVDHRIPVAWGGGRDAPNLQLLCATHNRWKSDQLPGE